MNSVAVVCVGVLVIAVAINASPSKRSALCYPACGEHEVCVDGLCQCQPGCARDASNVCRPETPEENEKSSSSSSLSSSDSDSSSDKSNGSLGGSSSFSSSENKGSSSDDSLSSDSSSAEKIVYPA